MYIAFMTKSFLNDLSFSPIDRPLLGRCEGARLKCTIDVA
jgi:hypothetical protein